MLFQKRFFRRSKQYLPQNMDSPGSKSVKKKNAGKTHDKPVQILKVSNTLKQSGYIVQRVIPGEKDSQPKEVVKTFQPCALTKLKMTSSEWYNPYGTSNTTILHSNKKVVITSTLRKPENVTSDHPAFRSSLYTGTQFEKKSGKQRRFGSLDVKSIRPMQSIQESEDEHLYES